METPRLYQPLTLMLKLTDLCPNNCMDGQYCFSSCKPDSRTWIDSDKIEGIFDRLIDVGIREVCYVSAEPFTRLDLLEDVTRKAVTCGITPRFLVTNGRIGISYENALMCFSRLRDAGFTTEIDEDYLGTGYNGVDVSVDQFHEIPSLHLSNTILAALEVFGPTMFVNIRNTFPSRKYLDHTTLNEVVGQLKATEKFVCLHRANREVVFHDGSRLKITAQPMNKFGNACVLPDDYFTWYDFNPEDLREYKDLREFFGFELNRRERGIYPFHKLYLDPDGECYPELGRFKVLGGGNAYHQSLTEIISNIDTNPLIPVIMGTGIWGIIALAEKVFGIKPDLPATGDLHLHDKYLSQEDLMEGVKKFARESGLETRLRGKLLPSLVSFRRLFLGNKKHLSVQ